MYVYYIYIYIYVYIYIYKQETLASPPFCAARADLSTLNQFNEYFCILSRTLPQVPCHARKSTMLKVQWKLVLGTIGPAAGTRPRRDLDVTSSHMHRHSAFPRATRIQKVIASSS